MNTTAANQADRQIEPVSEDPLGNMQARWSTDDELLVWTVSRLEGGRRQGVERDCHVVYALSSGFFVEQTRKFRASAEQCIDMLQQGKRAGTTQRKIALDSIVAIKSDPRSGRLHIRTLNGTHRLEPVSNEEADVLRQVGAELALRMPAGGASFADYSGPLYTERRRAQNVAEPVKASAEQERHALAALENARVEDGPDAYSSPTYDDLEGDLEEMPLDADDPGLTGSVSAADLRRIAMAVNAEMGRDSDVAEELPGDITVAGGVNITFDPAPEYAPTSPTEYVAAEEPAPDYAPPEYVAAQESAPDYVPADYAPTEYVAAVESAPDYAPAEYAPADHAPAEYVAAAPDYAPAEYAPAEHAPGNFVAAEDPTEYPTESLSFDEPAAARLDPDTYNPGAHEADEIPQNFDRRQQRALRRQIEGAPESIAADHSAGVLDTPDPTPDSTPNESGINLPAGAVFQPVAESPAHPEIVPVVDDAHLRLSSTETQSDLAFDPLVSAEDRRLAEDPSFPSVFDRRGAEPTLPPSRPGWAGFGDPDDNGDEAHDLDTDPNSEPEDSVDEPDQALPSAPPTLSAPTGGQVMSTGAVGFNPDFDVNPFR